MRRSIGIVASLLLLSTIHSLPAQAGGIDPATATCGEMTKVFGSSTDTKADKDGQTRIGVLLLWMAGFLAPESQGSVFDLVQLHADIEKIALTCKETPALGLKTVASKLWEKEQPTTPNSIDISTLTCASLMQERSAAAMLWLIGNYASEEDTPMFDMDTVGETATKIGTVCAKSPNMSLATAAEKVLE